MIATMPRKPHTPQAATPALAAVVAHATLVRRSRAVPAVTHRQPREETRDGLTATRHGARQPAAASATLWAASARRLTPTHPGYGSCRGMESPRWRGHAAGIFPHPSEIPPPPPTRGITAAPTASTTNKPPFSWKGGTTTPTLTDVQQLTQASGWPHDS